MMASKDATDATVDNEPVRLKLMRKVLIAHIDAWRKTIPADIISKSYPTLNKRNPALLPELFEDFWGVLRKHIEQEFEDLHEGAHLAERLHTLESLMTELKNDATSKRAVPLPDAPPEEEMRNIAGETKSAYASQLEDTVAELKRRNEEIENGLRSMQQRAQSIKASITTKVDIFKQTAALCTPALSDVPLMPKDSLS